MSTPVVRARVTKIAIIHPFQFRFARGIERFNWALATHMARRGVLVDILTWQSPEPVDWGGVPPGVQIRQVPDVRYFMHWAAVPHYVHWLARGNYDWVVIYFAGYGEAAALAMLKLIRRQRCCIVLHYPVDLVPHRYQEFERFRLARRADRLIAVSPRVARGARSRFARVCEVIGNGVDADQFSPSIEKRAAVRRRFGLDESDKVLISLSALEERKGLQWVIRALPRLLPEFPRLHYWILGEGAYRESLEAEIRCLGLGEHVWLPGAISDVAPLLAAADVACLPSKGEAYPIAMLECMAMELPVVTSCHPPFDELVERAWGEMAEETNTARLAETLGALLRDPLRRRSMGRAGRQHVLHNCTWEQVTDRYLRVLENRENAPEPLQS